MSAHPASPASASADRSDPARRLSSRCSFRCFSHTVTALLVVTNDIFTEEDAQHVRSTLAGLLAPERVVGVETGSCPHTAVRDDPSMNLDAVAELTHRFPDADVVLVESGGDNLTLTFSGVLADYFIFVIDVAEGDKIPRKRGPGVTNSDLLVINKIDLAPHVRADLAVMDRDARAVRGGRPFVFTNCFTNDGVGKITDLIEQVISRQLSSPTGG